MHVRLRWLNVCGLSLVFSVGLLTLWGCKSRSWKKLSSAEMRELLPQMMLAQAMLSDTYTPDSVRQASYKQFLEARGLTMSDWDSSLLWYSTYRIEELREIYIEVMDRLAAQKLLLQTQKDSIDRVEQRQMDRFRGLVDSVNLLRDSVSYHRPGMLVNRTFVFAPAMPYTSSRTVFSVRVLGLKAYIGKSLCMMLRMEFTDSTAAMQIREVPSAGLFRIELEVPYGKQMNMIRGYLRGSVPDVKGCYLAVDSFSLVRYPIGTTSPQTPLPADQTVTEGVTALEMEEL